MMGYRNAILFCLFAAAACSKPAPPAESPETSAKAEEPTTKLAESAKEKPAPTAKAIPDDVSKFIAQREGCDHFRGEEAYDEERGRFIRDNVEKLCKGSDAELAALKTKYARQADMLAKLSVFENTIE